MGDRPNNTNDVDAKLREMRERSYSSGTAGTHGGAGAAGTSSSGTSGTGGTVAGGASPLAEWIADDGIARTSVEFVKKSGERYGFPYSGIVVLHLRSAAVIELRFSLHKVLIKGRGLTPLYRQLVARTVAEVAETAGNAANLAPDDTPVVTDIDVREVE